MSWGSLDAFLSMGGYGLYVWGSYAVTFALIAAEIVMLRTRRRALLDQLQQAAGARSRIA